MRTPPKPVDASRFAKLFDTVCNWGKWGKDDCRGTLNYITPQRMIGAAQCVKTGRSISLAIPINTVAGPDNPHPAQHYMTQAFDVAHDRGEPRFAGDYLGSECHGDCHTHVDALCHVSYRGRLYGGIADSAVTSRRAEKLDIAAFADGIVGRGVLIDIPRLRGVPWLEPGDAVTAEELLAAEKAEGVTLGEGDILLFRTGHHRRRLELGPWDNSYGGEGKAGLHVEAMVLLHERKIAAFLPDGDGETVPSLVEGVDYPIHVLQIAAMGMACADSLELEELAAACEAAAKWDFLVVAAPLRLEGGTGSLFNPIAIL